MIMNLFENLQTMHESENKIISEFKEFLASKNAQYIYNELGETKDGMQIVIYDGDWKHEHLYMKHLLDEFFTNKGIDISITSEEIGESDQDTYSARYDITFNSKPKEYRADVKSLKFTTEDIEDSFDNDGLLTELRTNIGPHNELRYEIIQDGVLLFHTTNEELAKEKFKEISKIVPKEYKKVNGKYKKFSGDGELASMWESKNIRYQVTCQLATSNDDVYSEHSTLKDAIASARKAQQSFTNVKIKDLSDGSSWSDIDNAEQDLKDGIVKESNDDNAATFLDKIEKEITDATHKFMMSKGFPEDEVNEYSRVSTDITDDYVKISVGAELEYDSLFELCQTLDKIIEKEDKDAYFEPECPGRIVAYLFGEKAKEVHKKKEQALKNINTKSIKESADGLSKISKNDILYRVIWDSEDDDTGKIISYTVVDIYYNDGVFIKLKSSNDEITLPLDEDTLSFFIKDKDSAERTSKSFKSKSIYFSPNTALDDFDNYVNAKSIKESINKLEETNHNDILDKDYATGEEMYNEFVKYLNSLDQIAMDGKDCNWEPSEFNAKNLNADGEIYLECGAYILIYPYINEWAEDYFRVLVIDAETCELSIQLKNGIERIFNKFKTDKWELKFED